jgi:hypothetical protein
MRKLWLNNIAPMWQSYEEAYRTVFSTALNKLSKEDSLAGDEDDISQVLSFQLRQVCSDIKKIGRIELQTPVCEVPLQIVSEEDISIGKKGKRPDFTCILFNNDALKMEDREIPLNIECKLVGNPTSKSWILNKNYVTNGLQRFDSKTHEYGKRAKSGMMIGYIISNKPEDNNKEVNEYKNTLLTYFPDIFFNFNSELVSETDQSVQRKVVPPQEFKLIHLWVDLRKIYKFQ